MPEIPDLTVYIDALEDHLTGSSISGIRIANPFILRSVEPPVDAFYGRRVVGIRRIGKRIVIKCEGEFFIVVHLMIAGRLRWYRTGTKIPAKLGLIAFDFNTGTLILTEASQKHRASVYLVEGMEALESFDAGGIEVLDSTFEEFRSALTTENHTLKRSLTDQRFIAGIGNAYSDEILHRAKISPMRQIKYLDDEQWRSLYEATKSVLIEWIERLQAECGNKFPDKVTAFHKEMAVHGKYKQPCPVCNKPVQRIRYATNECNYCAECQNQGNLLADRGLSRLLKKDWPRTLEELDHL